MLDTRKEGKIQITKFIKFLTNPAEIENSQIMPLQQKTTENTSSPQDEIYEKIAHYVNEKNVDMKLMFRFYDANHNEKLDIENFLAAINSGKMPISAIEGRSIFENLKDPETKLLNYEDFISKIDDLLMIIREKEKTIKREELNEINIPMSYRDLKFKLLELERENADLRKTISGHEITLQMTKALKDSTDTLNIRKNEPQIEEINCVNENIKPAESIKKPLRQRYETILMGNKGNLSSRLLGLHKTMPN